MTITSQLFEAYVKCPTKCWLRYAEENVRLSFVRRRRGKNVLANADGTVLDESTGVGADLIGGDGRVAKRLVEEAKVRQVIVLTHDTVFLGELLDHIEQGNVDNLMHHPEWVNGRLIGREIVEEEQRGQRRAGYGAKVLADPSACLERNYGKGYSGSSISTIQC